MAYTQTQLTLLKVDLGLMRPTEDQLTYLGHLLNAARQRITKEGIALTDGNADHDALVVMYAAWMYRKRAQQPDQQAMPRMLRYQLNCELANQHTQEAAP